jgi:hypothetical protein
MNTDQLERWRERVRFLQTFLGILELVVLVALVETRALVVGGLAAAILVVIVALAYVRRRLRRQLWREQGIRLDDWRE